MNKAQIKNYLQDSWVQILFILKIKKAEKILPFPP